MSARPKNNFKNVWENSLKNNDSAKLAIAIKALIKIIDMTGGEVSTFAGKVLEKLR